MNRFVAGLGVVFVLLLLAAASGRPTPTPAAAAAAPFASEQPGECLPDGMQTSGSVYRICLPDTVPWNGDLILWAHGYVAFNEPIAIPEDQLCAVEGLCLNDIANALGFAFATNSYSVNGLAVREGIADLLDLVDIFTAETGLAPNNVILIGASMGGLITALSVEQYPDVYAGGMAVCGPVGSFTGQINAGADARLLFDYFFGDLLEPGMGDPFKVPAALIANWETYYPTVVEPVVFDPANAALLDQWVATANLAFDPADREATLRQTVYDVLWGAVFSANDGHAKLGGMPFDNLNRVYRGSADDARLNALVARRGADRPALVEMAAHYETSGVLTRPLVTLHNQWDPQVPAWQEFLYANKVMAAGSADYVTFFPSYGYGHCTPGLVEVFVAFGTLYTQIVGDGLDPLLVRTVLVDAADYAAYLDGVAAARGVAVSPLDAWLQR